MELNAELLESLIRHTAKELRNSAIYLAAYSWSRAEGWEGFAKRWKNAAVDEAKHAQNFVKFAAKYGHSFAPWPEADADAVPTSVEGLAALELELEKDTLDSMNHLAEVAEDCGDMAAVEWISTKLAEQQTDTKQSADFAARIADAARSGEGTLAILDRRLEDGGW